MKLRQLKRWLIIKIDVCYRYNQMVDILREYELKCEKELRKKNDKSKN